MRKLFVFTVVAAMVLGMVGIVAGAQAADTTLQLIKKPDGGSAFWGTKISFRIILKNTGANEAQNVTIDDTLPTANGQVGPWTIVPDTNNPSGNPNGTDKCTITGGNVLHCGGFNLDPGEIFDSGQTDVTKASGLEVEADTRTPANCSGDTTLNNTANADADNAPAVSDSGSIVMHCPQQPGNVTNITNITNITNVTVITDSCPATTDLAKLAAANCGLVSGKKWRDLNANNKQDNFAPITEDHGDPPPDPAHTEEGGLPGWEIHISPTLNPTTAHNHLHAITSIDDPATPIADDPATPNDQEGNEAGRYQFAVPAGTYFVCETLKDGWEQTTPGHSDQPSPTGPIDCQPHTDSGDNCEPPNRVALSGNTENCGYRVVVTAGQEVKDRDFGDRESCSDLDSHAVEAGTLSGPIHGSVEPGVAAVPGVGGTLRTVVHTINCTVIVALGL